MKKILVVDDDTELRANLVEILEGVGYQAGEAASAQEALEKATAEHYDIVLLDLIMPGGDGAGALTGLKKISPRSRVIMITAFATVENAVDAVRRGASDYISKPFKIDKLITTIRRVIKEASFEHCDGTENFDCILSCLANPIRRKILHILSAEKNMRLMEIVKELDIDDHTKVIFHLKMMKEADIIEHDSGKSYSLTKQGERIQGCLKTMVMCLAT